VRFAAIAVLAFAVSLSAQTKGLLCFGAQCVATSEEVIDIEPADAVRQFVWTSSDGKRIAAGELAPKETTIDLAAKWWREVALRISGDPSRGWPLETRFELTRRDKTSWTWSLPAATIGKLTTLRLPVAQYHLAFAAAHHIDDGRTFELSGRERLDLGEIRLLPLPLLTGTIFTKRKDELVPVASASVSRIDGTPLTSSDATGAFRYELRTPANQRPLDAIAISAPGLGTKVVAIQAAPGDHKLGTIELVRGTSLRVKLVRPEVDGRAVTVELLRVEPRQFDLTTIATRQLAAHENELSFSDLMPGEHFVLVRGSGPFERIARKVKIESGPASVEVEIRPFRLEGHVTLGGTPLTEAAIELGPDWRAWSESQTLDDRGRFGGMMWQPGVASAAVMNFSTFGAYNATSPELGADPSVWNIDIPNRTISGRVFDAATGELIPRAGLQLRSETALSTVAVKDGRYQILAVEPGTYTFDCGAEGYLHARITVTVREGDGPKVADIAMRKGQSQTVELRWENGAPVTNATVFEGPLGAGSFRQTAETDAAGHVTIRGVAGEAQTLYVVPAEGSLAVVHVVIGPDARATIPLPAGTLRIVESKPAGFLLRFDGDIIPDDVLLFRYGYHFPYDAKGELVLDRLPAGLYEVWPIVSRSNPFEPLLSPPPIPPARVGLSSGEVTVNLPIESAPQ